MSLLAIGMKGLIVGRVLCQKKDWRPEFQESDQIVWLIYYQLSMNMSTIMFPHLILVQPFLFAIVFLAYYHYLRYWAKSPIQ